MSSVENNRLASVACGTRIFDQQRPSGRKEWVVK